MSSSKQGSCNGHCPADFPLSSPSDSFFPWWANEESGTKWRRMWAKCLLKRIMSAQCKRHATHTAPDSSALWDTRNSIEWLDCPRAAPRRPLRKRCACYASMNIHLGEQQVLLRFVTWHISFKGPLTSFMNGPQPHSKVSNSCPSKNYMSKIHQKYLKTEIACRAINLSSYSLAGKEAIGSIIWYFRYRSAPGSQEASISTTYETPEVELSLREHANDYSLTLMAR